MGWTVSSGELPSMELPFGTGPSYDPINELMRAIILRTIEDFNSSVEFREEAIEYMYSEEEDYVFSFIAICKHLGMDPEKTRYSIMNATRRISTRRRAA